MNGSSEKSKVQAAFQSDTLGAVPQALNNAVNGADLILGLARAAGGFEKAGDYLQPSRPDPRADYSATEPVASWVFLAVATFMGTISVALFAWAKREAAASEAVNHKIGGEEQAPLLREEHFALPTLVLQEKLKNKASPRKKVANVVASGVDTIAVAGGTLWDVSAGITLAGKIALFSTLGAATGGLLAGCIALQLLVKGSKAYFEKKEKTRLKEVRYQQKLGLIKAKVRGLDREAHQEVEGDIFYRILHSPQDVTRLTALDQEKIQKTIRSFQEAGKMSPETPKKFTFSNHQDLSPAERTSLTYLAYKSVKQSWLDAENQINLARLERRGPASVASSVSCCLKSDFDANDSDSDETLLLKKSSVDSESAQHSSAQFPAPEVLYSKSNIVKAVLFSSFSGTGFGMLLAFTAFFVLGMSNPITGPILALGGLVFGLYKAVVAYRDYQDKKQKYTALFNKQSKLQAYAFPRSPLDQEVMPKKSLATRVNQRLSTVGAACMGFFLFRNVYNPVLFLGHVGAGLANMLGLLAGTLLTCLASFCFYKKKLNIDEQHQALDSEVKSLRMNRLEAISGTTSPFRRVHDAAAAAAADEKQRDPGLGGAALGAQVVRAA